MAKSETPTYCVENIRAYFGWNPVCLLWHVNPLPKGMKTLRLSISKALVIQRPHEYHL